MLILVKKAPDYLQNRHSHSTTSQNQVSKIHKPDHHLSSISDRPPSQIQNTTSNSPRSFSTHRIHFPGKNLMKGLLRLLLQVHSINCLLCKNWNLRNITLIPSKNYIFQPICLYTGGRKSKIRVIGFSNQVKTPYHLKSILEMQIIIRNKTSFKT